MEHQPEAPREAALGPTFARLGYPARVGHDRIREVVEGLPEIHFALLFGSRAGSGNPRPDSDWDVAVYVDDTLDSAERHALRLRLIAALEPETPVDVAVLNDAPALLAHRALCGDLILMRDRQAWVRFFVRTLARANDEAWWHELHARERVRRLGEGRFGRP